MAPTKTPATTSPGTLAPNDWQREAQMFAALLDRIPSRDGDGMAILADVLNVESLEGLAKLDAAASLPSVGRDDHLLDVNITVTGISKLESKYENDNGGPTAYLLVDSVDPETGETSLFSCGALVPMTKLAKVRELGGFPCQVMFSRGKKTRSGNYPINMSLIAFNTSAVIDQ